MLTDELRKIVIDSGDQCKFHDAGIVLFCPSDEIFYRISFGDGTDNEPVDDCDEYLYIAKDRYDEYGYFSEDFDGGNMWFHSEDYTGYIDDEKMIRDALEFVDCPDIDGCILITHHG